MAVSYTYDVTEDSFYKTRDDIPAIKMALKESGVTDGLHSVALYKDIRFEIFYYEPVSDEIKTKIDNVMTNTNMLPVWKKQKYAAIDAKTDELINSGFDWDGYRFSISIESQSRMLGVYQLRNEVFMEYPVIWNSLDDNNITSLEDAEDVANFFLTAVATFRGYVDSGTDMKDLVRAAETKEELDMIIDNR